MRAALLISLLVSVLVSRSHSIPPLTGAQKLSSTFFKEDCAITVSSRGLEPTEASVSSPVIGITRASAKGAQCFWQTRTVCPGSPGLVVDQPQFSPPARGAAWAAIGNLVLKGDHKQPALKRQEKQGKVGQSLLHASWGAGTGRGVLRKAPDS